MPPTSVSVRKVRKAVCDEHRSSTAGEAVGELYTGYMVVISI